eukprot:gene30006-36241_t
MKVVKAVVMGWVYLGGGFGMHAEYQLLVSAEDPQAQWSIYRRYSVFERLYEQLVEKFGGNKLFQLGVSFPAKNYWGSRLNATGEAIGVRMMELQAFLDKLVQSDDLNNDSPLIIDFFDLRGRGMSGVAKEIGVENICKESLVRVKILRNLPFSPMWTWCYLVLRNDGVFHILDSKYETSREALLTGNLTSNDLQVVAKSSTCVRLHSSIHEYKVYIKFNIKAIGVVVSGNVEPGVEGGESSFWIRALSEFSSAAGYQNIQGQIADVKASASSPGKGLKPIPQDDIVHPGTGNTPDELSNMYGI